MKFYLIIWLLLFAQLSHADLLDLTPDDFNKISKDLSAFSSYSSVSAATSNSLKIEFGLLGSLTQTPNFQDVLAESDPSANVSQLYNATLYAALSTPFGFRVELELLPPITVSSVNEQYYALAGQYQLLSFPVALSMKAHLAENIMSYSDTINNSSTFNTNVGVDLNFSDFVYGLDLLVSKSFFIVEPYAGIGFESSNTNMNISRSSEVAPSLSNEQSANLTRSSLRLFIGAELDLTFIKIGAEYLRCFDTDRVTFKISGQL